MTYLVVFFALLIVCAVGLWANVLLEGYKCVRTSRSFRRLRRRCTHLERRNHELRAQRDHWAGRSAHWQGAYFRAAGHEGGDPHPTLPHLIPVPAVEEDDAPVP